jgi:hypothetical protein
VFAAMWVVVDVAVLIFLPLPYNRLKLVSSQFRHNLVESVS